MNHFATIWVSPRATIRDILDTRPGKLFFPLAATGGIAQSLATVIQRAPPPDVLTVLQILIINVLWGALYGTGAYFLLSYLLAGLGRLFVGRSSARAARTVLAWSSVPYLVLLVVIILLIAVTGDNLIFHSQQDILAGVAGTSLQLVSLIYFLIYSILWIWGIVIGVKGLSEAFYISTGRSFLVMLLTIVIFGALFIGGLVVWGLVTASLKQE